MLRLMRGLVCAITMLNLMAAAAAQSAAMQQPPSGDTSANGRTLVWSDEFNGPDGSGPDPARWAIVTNDSGYGNNELEYYTDRTSNIREQDGSLVITARHESYVGKDGQSRDYTSGRIESRGHFALKYGRIEARIKLPKGQGLWPAFWMLGSDFSHLGWPACGEIDIMENIGSEPSKVHGSLHGPGYSGGQPLSGMFTLPNQARFADDYHVFAIEWEPRAIRFYVDGTLYETQTPDNVPVGQRWVFDHPFYLVLNVAVGGYWPGNPDATTKFPGSMLVDYVRVYRLGDERAVNAKP
jgi:beta-glucanase (GH16 family)